MAGDPKGGVLKPGAGPVLPKGMGAGVEVWPNTGGGVPKEGLSEAPNANAPICGAALFTGVPNCAEGAAPNLKGVEGGAFEGAGG